MLQSRRIVSASNYFVANIRDSKAEKSPMNFLIKTLESQDDRDALWKAYDCDFA